MVITLILLDGALKGLIPLALIVVGFASAAIVFPLIAWKTKSSTKRLLGMIGTIASAFMAIMFTSIPATGSVGIFFCLWTFFGIYIFNKNKKYQKSLQQTSHVQKQSTKIIYWKESNVDEQKGPPNQ